MADTSDERIVRLEERVISVREGTKAILDTVVRIELRLDSIQEKLDTRIRDTENSVAEIKGRWSVIAIGLSLITAALISAAFNYFKGG